VGRKGDSVDGALAQGLSGIEESSFMWTCLLMIIRIRQRTKRQDGTEVGVRPSHLPYGFFVSLKHCRCMLVVCSRKVVNLDRSV
jgi:hypothetical protein